MISINWWTICWGDFYTCCLYLLIRSNFSTMRIIWAHFYFIIISITLRKNFIIIDKTYQIFQKIGLSHWPDIIFIISFCLPRRRRHPTKYPWFLRTLVCLTQIVSNYWFSCSWRCVGSTCKKPFLLIDIFVGHVYIIIYFTIFCLFRWKYRIIFDTIQVLLVGLSSHLKGIRIDVWINVLICTQIWFHYELLVTLIYCRVLLFILKTIHFHYFWGWHGCFVQVATILLAAHYLVLSHFFKQRVTYSVVLIPCGWSFTVLSCSGCH